MYRLAQTSLLVGAALVMRSRMQPALAQPAPVLGQPALAQMKLELAVKMHCESCTSQVKQAILENNKGVTQVEVDLDSETVVVNGTFVTSEVLKCLNRVGRDARVVGTGSTKPIEVPKEVGSASDGLVAAVVEFKGPVFNHGNVLGVVRIVQVDADSVAVDIELDGLAPNQICQVAVHEFGDTRLPIKKHVGKPLHVFPNVASTTAQGKLVHRDVLSGVFVWEWIGRALVVETVGDEAVGAVIARSAGVGDNSKKRLCTCDGTVIWEA
ncbi:hypothetical protein BASA81_013740 [Batrachochytrium salamandrivorans]|nr:hypothetical protein BASA81_013740 [Batrachochytrium salamandrivorans]